MLPVLSEKLSSYFVRSKIIRQEDKEIYSYSVEVLLATVINFAMLYAIAFIMGRVWETTLFIAGFVPLRSLAGGYHAKNHLRCLMVLLFTYIGFLAAVYLIPHELYLPVNIGCVCVSIICVWLLSPVGDKNKPLSASEKKHFRIRSRAVIFIYAGVILAGTLLFQHRIEFLCISVGIVSVSLSLVAAYLRNKRTVTPTAGP